MFFFGGLRPTRKRGLSVNYPNSEGMVYQVEAVEKCIRDGLLECPDARHLSASCPGAKSRVVVSPFHKHQFTPDAQSALQRFEAEEIVRHTPSHSTSCSLPGLAGPICIALMSVKLLHSPAPWTSMAWGWTIGWAGA